MVQLVAMFIGLRLLREFGAYTSKEFLAEDPQTAQRRAFTIYKSIRGRLVVVDLSFVGSASKAEQVHKRVDCVHVIYSHASTYSTNPMRTLSMN